MPNTSIRWAVFALLCVTPIFFSLGNHAIHGDSEARYGVIARGMAEGETSWWVPTYFDQPHLTKPPLTYWLMAISMRLLGDSEWALRLPAALAGVGTLGVVFGFAWRRYGRDAAVVGTAVLSITPLFVAISRLAITDSFLGLFCTAALTAGALAVAERKTRWTWVLWAATALALLTKGPAGLLPIAALFAWIMWTRPERGWRSLCPWLGLPAAVLPLMGWGLLIAWQNPEVWAIWKFETFNRAVGTGDHPEPWWFFGPVALVGLLPSSALCLLVICKRYFRDQTNKYPDASARPAARTQVNCDHLKQDKTLWIAMLLITISIFSLISGKLMSYLMPLCGPAVLLILHLLYYSKKFYKFPNPSLYSTRSLWATSIFTLICLAIAEDFHANQGHPKDLIAKIQQKTSLTHPHIVTVGPIDRRLPYYTRQPTERVDPRMMPPKWNALRKEDLILVADPIAWDKFAASPNWDLTRRYVQLDFTVQLGKYGNHLRVYRPRPELR